MGITITRDILMDTEDMVDITMARETQRLNQNQVTMGITITRDILMDTEDMVDTTMARETQRLNQNQATITITITRAILMAMAMVIMDELIKSFNSSDSLWSLVGMNQNTLYFR